MLHSREVIRSFECFPAFSWRKRQQEQIIKIQAYTMTCLACLLYFLAKDCPEGTSLTSLQNYFKTLLFKIMLIKTKMLFSFTSLYSFTIRELYNLVIQRPMSQKDGLYRSNSETLVKLSEFFVPLISYV